MIMFFELVFRWNESCPAVIGRYQNLANAVDAINNSGVNGDPVLEYERAAMLIEKYGGFVIGRTYKLRRVEFDD